MTEQSTYLPIHAANAEVLRDELEPLLGQRPLPFQLLLRYSRQIRIRGIAGLLMEGDVRSLHTGLAASGRAFAQGLQHVQTRDQVLSQYTPFFDALAVEDEDTIRALATAGLTLDWAPEYEYEEDYEYLRFLMTFIVGDTPEVALARFQECAEGLEDPRVDFCAALVHQDHVALDSAMEDVLEARAEKMVRLSSSGALAPQVVATEGFINVEGMALVSLVRRVGGEANTNYRGVPAISPPQSEVLGAITIPAVLR